MNHTPEHTPGPWKWYWRTNDEGNADCGIYSEVREGQAYSVCRAPRFQTREKWEADARRIVACVNACADIPDDMVAHVVAFGLQGNSKVSEDNDTLRAALQTHAEEAAKLIGKRDELLAVLTSLERVAGLGLNYDDPPRVLARAAITNATL